MKLSKLREAIRKIIESEGKKARVCPSCNHHNTLSATKCLNCGYEPLTKKHDKII